MQTQINRLITTLALATGLAGLGGGCASQPVSVAEMSAPARAAAEKVTAGGNIDRVAKEKERGKVVYEVAATVSGKHAEFTIAEADGELLETETQIEFSELPEPVRAAAEKHFGTSTGLTVMKCFENGRTDYEIEGPKGRRTAEVTFDPDGKRH